MLRDLERRAAWFRADVQTFRINFPMTIVCAPFIHLAYWFKKVFGI